MKRSYYSDSIKNFLNSPTDEVLGKLTAQSNFAIEQTQRDAWIKQIEILQKCLKPYEGTIYFEYSVPRMGQRIDVVLLIGPVIFVLEFKIGEKLFTNYAIDQVLDYALDLKNFHATSHNQYVAPILIATQAICSDFTVSLTPQNDKLFFPIKINEKLIEEAINNVLRLADGNTIENNNWENGQYSPTPTIVEAAMALYAGHNVKDISRNDAKSFNLTQTSAEISKIIKLSKDKHQKSICFVTGVPGAGKTLVGLDIAMKHSDKSNDMYSVFLSGNGPLVAILREALTRDKLSRLKKLGEKRRKGEVMQVVKTFIQNVHNFRDECLLDTQKAPIEHVALFDEAQRAWNKQQTIDFMRRKKGKPDFSLSEPEFLISCLDRHPNWAVIVCLVGGGQEINTGEAGISEWINSLKEKYAHWKIYISSRLTDEEYRATETLKTLSSLKNVTYSDNLHLSVSMRSFRAEHVSLLVKQMLDLNLKGAQETLKNISAKYPIVITRDLNKAKQWLKEKARGTERYGIVVSSQAERLKPHAIDVKSPMDPIHWFLDDKEDVRSSYYLEDVATEFHIQGLELDWVCVTWDADFRFLGNKWGSHTFRGSKWQNIVKAERKEYLKNAYRVLLTRARQGMVIVVPKGDPQDHTRSPAYYDPIYDYLKEIGFVVL